jgi:hypothetical protein
VWKTLTVLPVPTRQEVITVSASVGETENVSNAINIIVVTLFFTFIGMIDGFKRLEATDWCYCKNTLLTLYALHFQSGAIQSHVSNTLGQSYTLLTLLCFSVHFSLYLSKCLQ